MRTKVRIAQQAIDFLLAPNGITPKLNIETKIRCAVVRASPGFVNHKQPMAIPSVVKLEDMRIFEVLSDLIPTKIMALLFSLIQAPL